MKYSRGMNKKGFELAVNTLVVIILSLVLLGVGFWLFFTLAGETQRIDQDVSDQLKRQIEQEMEDSGKRVYIPTVLKTIGRGKTDYFTIGIVNLFPPADFTIKAGLDAVVSPTCAPDCPLVIESGLSLHIDENEQEYRKIWVNVPKKALSGQYVINVDVCTAQQMTEQIKCTPDWDYPPPFKIYVVVP